MKNNLVQRKGGYTAVIDLCHGVNCPNSPSSREKAGFDYLNADEQKSFYSKIYLEAF